ncbi:MAG: ATP-binding cassette domain-containing protein [Epsilonproteobacteria bacterium]|nr:ATP-binding cassette domain-containing protein [Campylobacterota bacterium]
MIDINVTKELHGADGNMQLAVNLRIAQGEFVALSGKSGSGKTTLLRILAGLEEAEGTISVDTERWLREKHALPPQKREIGFVFQDYALFENMTIEQNLLFVANDKALAKELLELTELTALKNRHPHTLSGGQKQRVSICRALMRRPKILLLDEPLSALDATMRTKLQNELLTLHKTFQTTTIMVSHDPSEIYRLASRVIVLENGTLSNDSKPTDVLLKQQGSQKFTFQGELLEIKKVDVIFIAIVAIGQQLVEVVLSAGEATKLHVGDKITLSTKAFHPTITN